MYWFVKKDIDLKHRKNVDSPTLKDTIPNLLRKLNFCKKFIFDDVLWTVDLAYVMKD